MRRSALAILLTFAMLVVAAAPHVHAHAGEGQDCVACAATSAGADAGVEVDVAPPVLVPERVVLAPAAAPVTGAPLGAIPGQSPPAA